jgi:DNA polymerase
MTHENTQLESIRNTYKNCFDCPLSGCRKSVVFGTGNPRAGILLVTDTPTESQDRVGNYNTIDIGWTLGAFKCVLSNAGHTVPDRKEDLSKLFFSEVFITSAVMCRPIHLKGGKIGDYREPTWAKEVKKCRTRLLSTVYAVDPHIIVCAGKFATQALLGRSSALPARRGALSALFEVVVPGKSADVRYSAIPAPDPTVCQRLGDYDDPNGMVSAYTNALSGAWTINQYLRNEDK